jgi:hypothetical protein
MKEEMTCSIVQDLLPNYIEKLTSNETNIVIEKHLETCENCKEVYEQMTVDVGNIVKVPTIELKFLKKVKRTRLLAAALCIALTLVLSYLLYDSEFHYSIDKDDLSLAITEFTEPFKNPVDAYALETKEIDGTLFVTFKDQSNPNMYGIAEFSKGINQRYRIIRTQKELSEFSSVVETYQVKIKDEQYVAVSGYNLSEEIGYYGLDYATYSEPGQLSNNRVRRSVKFEVMNPQFLELYSVEELNSLLKKTSDEPLDSSFLVATSIYDTEGVDITENYRNLEKGTEDMSSGAGKAELFLIYIYIAIVMGLGVILTRYFLT